MSNSLRIITINIHSKRSSIVTILNKRTLSRDCTLIYNEYIGICVKKLVSIAPFLGGEINIVPTVTTVLVEATDHLSVTPALNEPARGSKIRGPNGNESSVEFTLASRLRKSQAHSQQGRQQG